MTTTTATDTDILLEDLRQMARIRAFEERVSRHFRAGDIPGFVHVSIGQEAIAAGVCGVLTEDDKITTTHRGHGHCLAKGADPTAMMAELFGRATGTCRGRGGSMHIADASRGILGANGIVAAGLPLAVGAALAAKTIDSGAVAVAFAGEGTVHSGAFHEALTLAVLWQAPAVVVIENNRFAEFTDSDRMWRGAPQIDRAKAYGVPHAERIDGNDVAAVRAAAAHAAAAARAGEGPVLIEAMTYRIHGHYEGDAVPYRDPDEFAEAQQRDPIARAVAQLADADRADEAERVLEEAAAEMDAAVQDGLAAPYPDPATVLEDIHA
jgi:TPP-dependent pyruvate/acetoin dehydrogenase alpha subunit